MPKSNVSSRAVVAEVSLADVRRLAVSRQHLAGRLPKRPTGDAIVELLRDIGCVQLDPTSAVARSHLLVLFSRIGGFDPEAVRRLHEDERRIFEYLAHAASIVLTEDLPIHRYQMRRYAKGRSTWHGRVLGWMRENDDLRRHILDRLRADGPLRLRDFEDRSKLSWKSLGWTNERNVSRMLDFLWIQGRVTVARRTGGTRWWDLFDRWVPPWAPDERLTEREATRRAAERALRALGVAQARHVEQYFIRGGLVKTSTALPALEREGRALRVDVRDGGGRGGPWFVHIDNADLLEDASRWRPRTTLLSPFDNLIIDRDRLRQVFGFEYTIEIYTPKDRRKYGYFVMPILDGDRLIGRVDPRMDRKRGVFVIEAVHAERDAPRDRATAERVARAIADLGRWLGATEIEYWGPRPRGWASALR